MVTKPREKNGKNEKNANIRVHNCENQSTAMPFLMKMFSLISVASYFARSLSLPLFLVAFSSFRNLLSAIKFSFIVYSIDCIMRLISEQQKAIEMKLGEGDVPKPYARHNKLLACSQFNE